MCDRNMASSSDYLLHCLDRTAFKFIRTIRTIFFPVTDALTVHTITIFSAFETIADADEARTCFDSKKECVNCEKNVSR